MENRPSESVIKKTPRRYDWVDYAKGIAIFLVVYRHSFEGLKRAHLNTQDFMGLEYANILFFSFRMPLFFIVSGMFLSSSLVKRGLGTFTGQKAKTIIYPYFFWGILQISTQILFSGMVNSSRSAEDYLLLLYNPKGVDQFWYLYALFNVTILYAIIKTFFKATTTIQMVIGVAMYYLSTHASQRGWDLYFVLDILHYYIFLAFGDMAASFFREEKNAGFLGSFRLFAFLTPLFIVAQGYFLLTNLNHDAAAYRFVEDHQPTLFLLIALTGCAFMISISFILQRFNAASWLRIIGFHSLYIYVSHVFITSVCRTLLTKAGITYVPLMLLLCILLGVFIPIYFYRFCQARGWYFFFSLDKERAKLKPVRPSSTR